MTDYIFTLGGYKISWRTTLQHTVALSTTEAKYMAIKEAIWLRGLFGEISMDHEVTVVQCDS